jgi:hypothetical protein
VKRHDRFLVGEARTGLPEGHTVTSTTREPSQPWCSVASEHQTRPDRDAFRAACCGSLPRMASW